MQRALDLPQSNGIERAEFCPLAERQSPFLTDLVTLFLSEIASSGTMVYFPTLTEIYTQYRWLSTRLNHQILNYDRCIDTNNFLKKEYMSILIQNKSLEELAQAYFTNEAEQIDFKDTENKRAQQLPTLKKLTQQFIQHENNLSTFRDQLQSFLTHKDNIWGSKGPGFMMELNKLRKNHDEHHPIAENELRTVLTGINTDNLGERIGQFYNFLQREKTRLRQENKSSNQTMAPGNTAFMLSLFTWWLYPENAPVIYYFRTYMAIYALIEAKLLPDPGNLHLAYDANYKTTTISVRNQQEHLAFQATIQALIRAIPAFQSTPHAIEYFLYWLIPALKNTPTPPTLIQEIDDSDVLIKPVKSSTGQLKETPSLYTPSSPVAEPEADAEPSESPQFRDEPLQATPEPLLTQLIAEVQSHILVDESTIRRIYHALLAGHVILTGPPGTGKTELARILPEILWKSEINTDDLSASSESELSVKTAYTTLLVTATDDWSVRTLISGIAPQTKDGQVSYTIQYGHLTNAIRKNWSIQSENPYVWNPTLDRTSIIAPSKVANHTLQEFKGQWLVIDEFNRAPIDLALGDALTALGGNDMLRVAIEGGSAELPIPQDFRIIGTLNSFDRSYLNQISEALKRRFSFIEILPPTRVHREAEQGIVLYKALTRISHMSKAIKEEDETLTWNDHLLINSDTTGQYTLTWQDQHISFHKAFTFSWQLFEIIRIYRQLGTAQAITLFRHILIPGILRGYKTKEDWIAQAVDPALCDTLADQLQVLLPDEIDALLLYLTTDPTLFSEAYQKLLERLASNPSRLYGQLLALNSVIAESGDPFLSDEAIEQITAQDRPEVRPDLLKGLFHLEHPHYRLPQFIRRLRTFKTERGL